MGTTMDDTDRAAKASEADARETTAPADAREATALTAACQGLAMADAFEDSEAVAPSGIASRAGGRLGDARALLFDLDGTLIDTHDIILRSMRHAVNDVCGIGATDAKLMAGVGMPLFDQMMAFTGGDEVRSEEMVSIYRRHNDSIHDEGVDAFPGTADALRRLRALGYPMGVVTSKRHHMAERGLKLCGILGFFEFVIGSDDWPEHKPAPGPVLRGCELIGLAPAECVYVGDSPYDIQAGNAAGCMTAAALWGMFPERELSAEHPDVMCESLEGLADVLEASRHGSV